MDKLAALKVYVLWSWLERNPGRKKEEYPLFYELQLNKNLNRCPWCANYWDKSKYCSKCPLTRAGKSCRLYRSPYVMWSNYTYYSYGSTQAASKAAGDIAIVAKKEYERLWSEAHNFKYSM